MKLIVIVTDNHENFIRLKQDRPDNFIRLDPNNPEMLRGTAIDDYEIACEHPDMKYIENSILKPCKMAMVIKCGR